MQTPRNLEIAPRSRALGTARLPHLYADLRCVPLGVFLFVLPFAHTVALRLMALLAAVLVVLTHRDALKRLVHVPLQLPIALWAGLALASLAWAADRAYSLREIGNEIGYSLLAFGACYAMAATERAWRIFMGVLVAGFLAISGVGLYWFTHGLDQITDAPHAGVGYYSTYLVTHLPLLMVVAVRAAQLRFPAICMALLIPLLLLDGYGTGNRAFWPACLLAILTFAALHASRARSLRARGTVLAVTLAFVVLAASAFVATVQQRAGAAAGEGGLGLIVDDPRIPLWAHVTTMIERQPLSGGGFGRGVYGKELTGQFGSHILWHGHNLFLNYALQMGIGGVLVLVILLGAIGRAFWRCYRADDPIASLVGAAGVAMLVGVLAKNMTDDFFVRQNALMFWSIVGLSLGYGHRRMGGTTDDVPTRRSGAGSIAI
jgi:O-antigen ligase